MKIDDQRRNAIGQRVAALYEDYSSWKPDWIELEEQFLPRRTRFSTSDHNKGKKGAGDKIINSITTWSVRVLKSGMMSGHTSPTRPWFRLVTPDPDLMEHGPVKAWLYYLENRMREVFARSNIYNALPTMFGDSAVFGTAAMGVFKDDADVIRAYPYMPGSYAIANDHRLRADSLARTWREKPADVIRKFGMDAVSKEVRDAAREANHKGTVEICHLIQPNYGRDPSRVDFLAMPYESIYYEAGWKEGRALRVEGFKEMPILIHRWDVNGENAWGEGPALTCLGDAKELQFQEKRYSMLVDHMSDPATKQDPSLRNRGRSVMPGSRHFTPMGNGNPGVDVIYKPDPAALVAIEGKIAKIEARISRVMYTDMFLMLAESDRREITAREVEERHAEKLLMLGPVLERLADEMLDPLIQRTFRIMLEEGLVPEWPEELDEAPLRIEYTSILAQAQRSVARYSIEAMASFTGMVAGFDPSVVDKFDADQAMDEYGNMVGAPPTITRSDEATAARRRAREAMQQAAAAAAIAKDAGGAAQSFASAGREAAGAEQ